MPPSEQVVSNAEHKRYPVFSLVTASVLRFLPDFITTVRNDPLDRWIADSSSTTHPFEHHINRAFEAACVSEDERSAWISEVKNGFYAANFFAVPLKEIDVNFENVLVDGRSYVGVLRELLVHQKKVQIDVSKLTDTVEAQGDVISSQNQLLTMQEQQIQQLIASSNAQSEHINRMNDSLLSLTHLLQQQGAPTSPNHGTSPLPNHGTSPLQPIGPLAEVTANHDATKATPPSFTHEMLAAKHCDPSQLFVKFFNNRWEGSYAHFKEESRKVRKKVGSHASNFAALKKIVRNMCYLAGVEVIDDNFEPLMSKDTAELKEIAKKAIEVAAEKMSLKTDQITKTMLKGESSSATSVQLTFPKNDAKRRKIRP